MNVSEKDKITEQWRDWLNRADRKAEKEAADYLRALKSGNRKTAFYGVYDETGSINRARNAAGHDLKYAKYLLVKRKRKLRLAS